MKKNIILLLSVMCFYSSHSQPQTDNIKTNGHEYVDMGLSVLWATFNIGADSPESRGDYYAWGETATKEIFNYKSYKWYNNGDYNSLTKYCYDREYGMDGYTDNLIKLELEDDAAHVQWGGDWRMPSQMEFEELNYNSTVEWVQINGVNGCKFTSNIKGYEGRSIFLPCNGVEVNGHHMYDGEMGWYWTSDYYDYGIALGFNNLNPQPRSLNAITAGVFTMNMEERSRTQSSTGRECGLTLRAVISVEGKSIVVPDNIASRPPMGSAIRRVVGDSIR